MRPFIDLTKFGIVIFVLLSAIAGFGLSFQLEAGFDAIKFFAFLFGTYFISSGSLALNQIQEREMDRKMPRTEKRPLVTGRISVRSATLIVSAFLFLGFALLTWVSWISALVGLATIVLYNGLYTYWWKPKMIYAAVPGAIPGALPVTMGYAVNSPDLLAKDSIYAFGILFLWQMPHFWALAIRFRDDYGKANVPTLPNIVGLDRTLFQMGMYTFAYVLLALISPLFVPTSWFYLIVVMPFCYKIVYEFFRFYRSKGQERWLQYFLWINLSVLVFLAAPIIDQWLFVFTFIN